jgi:hypothetical protein
MSSGSPGVANSVTVPVGVMRMIAPPSPCAVYQMFPSGPATIPVGLSWRPPSNWRIVPSRGDPADLVLVALREPQAARPRGDPSWLGAAVEAR